MVSDCGRSRIKSGARNSGMLHRLEYEDNWAMCLLYLTRISVPNTALEESPGRKADTIQEQHVETVPLCAALAPLRTNKYRVLTSPKPPHTPHIDIMARTYLSHPHVPTVMPTMNPIAVPKHLS